MTQPAQSNHNATYTKMWPTQPLCSCTCIAENPKQTMAATSIRTQPQKCKTLLTLHTRKRSKTMETWQWKKINGNANEIHNTKTHFSNSLVVMMGNARWLRWQEGATTGEGTRWWQWRQQNGDTMRSWEWQKCSREIWRREEKREPESAIHEFVP